MFAGGTNAFYRINLTSGAVTTLATLAHPAHTGAETWATWGVSEFNGTDYSVAYVANSTTIQRLNLTTGVTSTVATFSSLSDMATFTVSPWNNRWYFHHEGTSQFRSGDETAGYADAVLTTGGAGCPSASRTAATATINTIPVATGVDASRCGPGTVTLTASGAPAGGSYAWYTVATGGTPIAGATTASYTTPSLSATTTYYVSALNSAANGSCEGPRGAVTATINTVPVAVGSDASRCGPGTVTLTASGAPAGGSYAWYTVATGGTPVATTASYTTPSLSATTTYYVSALNSAANGSCEGPRDAVNAVINPVPTITVTPSGPTTVCPGGSVTLSAASSADGYTVATTAYAPVAPTAVTNGPSGDDATAAALPFAFTYYGTSYTSVNISTNGNIQFGSNDPAYTAAPIPTAGGLRTTSP